MSEQRLVSRPNRILLIALVCGTLAAYLLVPGEATLPFHWDIGGNPDSFGPAYFVLVAPLFIALAVLLILAGIRRLAGADHFRNGRHILDAGITTVLSVTLAILAALVLIGRGAEVDMLRMLVLVLSVLLFALGNALPKSQPNAVAGIRTRKTLSDPANWRITHLWAGGTMLVTSVIAFGLAVIGAPGSALLATIILAALVPTVVAVIVSNRHAARKQA